MKLGMHAPFFIFGKGEGGLKACPDCDSCIVGRFGPIHCEGQVSLHIQATSFLSSACYDVSFSKANCCRLL